MTVYWVAADAYGDEALWSGTGPGDEKCDCVVYRHLLDKQDPILWPTVVAALVEPDPLKPGFGTDVDAEVRATYQRWGLIPAIREYRHLMRHTGLAEAREAVKRICNVHTDRVWEVVDASVPQAIGDLYREHNGEWQAQVQGGGPWGRSFYRGQLAMERAGYQLVEVTGHVGSDLR